MYIYIYTHSEIYLEKKYFLPFSGEAIVSSVVSVLLSSGLCTKRNPVQGYFSTGSFMAQLDVPKSLGAPRAGCSIGKGSQELGVGASSVLMGTGQSPVLVQGAW